MDDGSREEFERRLLALVREFLKDEPDDCEIGEFAFFCQRLYPPEENEQLETWPGRPPTGWWSDIGLMFSTSSDWLQEAMARETLKWIEDKRFDKWSDRREEERLAKDQQEDEHDGTTENG